MPRGGSRDVVIRRCVFEHDSTLADWRGGASPVFETYVRFPKPRPYPPGNYVFITGNRYVVPSSLGAFNPCINGDVQGLVVEVNTVMPPH